MFDIVVAADLDWGIGKASGLPWPRLRGDLQHFKRITSTAADGKLTAIVMGRKTWQSAEVGSKPLPKRLNVVITRSHDFEVPADVAVANSLDAALEAAYGPDIETVFVVGGAEIYREALGHPELRWIYLTRVEGHFACDAYLPNLDIGFTRVPWDGEQELEDNGVRYRFEKLRRAE